MKLDVCICTHNPRPEIWAIVLQALARQTLDKSLFHVWVIDNCSTPAMTLADLAPLTAVGIGVSLVLEPRLGNVYARSCAVTATQSELLLFVDDDNELADDYLATAYALARAHPEIGCMGGKLLLPPTLTCPPWLEPLLPYIAVIDRGEAVIANCADHWGPWEPPTAGALVRRPVLNQYLKQIEEIPETGQLGRKGSGQLLSGEDSLMMRGAFALGLQCAYQPSLKLYHHISPHRFQARYLWRLMYGYGRSFIILETLLGNTIAPVPWRAALKTILHNVQLRRREQSLGYALCLMAYDIGYFTQLRHQSLK
jgi:hypothetical protein